MIKAGQIRNHRKHGLFVITKVYKKEIYVVWMDDSCGKAEYYTAEDSDLIAEFPTWREAVNSKLFTGNENES